MSTDAEQVRALAGQPGSKVVFTGGDPDVLRTRADDLAAEAGLVPWSGYAVVEPGGPGLEQVLADLVGTGRGDRLVVCDLQPDGTWLVTTFP